MSAINGREDGPGPFPSTVRSALVLQMRRAAVEALREATQTRDRELASPDAVDEQRIERFAEKVAGDQSIAVAAVLAYIGDRLELWAALAQAGPVTADDLAAATGLHVRYLAEWLPALAAAAT